MTKSKIQRQLQDAKKPWTFSVDPGETVGVAYTMSGNVLHHNSLPPLEALKVFESWCAQRPADRDGCLYIEEYRIYPELAMVHAGKTIPTAENIGAFKWVAHRYDVPVVEQPASIKKTTAAMLRARGIQLQGQSRHSKDAELHFWYPILRTIYKEPQGPKTRKQKES